MVGKCPEKAIAMLSYIYPGSTDLGLILFTHAVQVCANVVITLDRVRKQYWPKIVQNFAIGDVTF